MKHSAQVLAHALDREAAHGSKALPKVGISAARSYLKTQGLSYEPEDSGVHIWPDRVRLTRHPPLLPAVYNPPLGMELAHHGMRDLKVIQEKLRTPTPTLTLTLIGCQGDTREAQNLQGLSTDSILWPPVEPSYKKAHKA